MLEFGLLSNELKEVLVWILNNAMNVDIVMMKLKIKTLKWDGSLHVTN